MFKINLQAENIRGNLKIRKMGDTRVTGSRHLPTFLCFNFFATTHRLGCDTLLTDLGGRGRHNLRYEGSCFFSKYLRVTPLSRGNGTNYNKGSSSLVRSSIKKNVLGYEELNPFNIVLFLVLINVSTYLYTYMYTYLYKTPVQCKHLGVRFNLIKS